MLFGCTVSLICDVCSHYVLLLSCFVQPSPAPTSQVILGRATDDVQVDINLGREGCANKISRRQVRFGFCVVALHG